MVGDLDLSTDVGATTLPERRLRRCVESLENVTVDEVQRVSRNGNITLTVVSAVAEATGIDMMELEPLHYVIDTDMLESFVRPRDVRPPAQATLRFTYEGVWVDVHDDGEVTVTTSESDNRDSNSGGLRGY